MLGGFLPNDKWSAKCDIFLGNVPQTGCARKVNNIINRRFSLIQGERRTYCKVRRRGDKFYFGKVTNIDFVSSFFSGRPRGF